MRHNSKPKKNLNTERKVSFLNLTDNKIQEQKKFPPINKRREENGIKTMSFLVENNIMS